VLSVILPAADEDNRRERINAISIGNDPPKKRPAAFIFSIFKTSKNERDY
jgi:hypothetical protein